MTAARSFLRSLPDGRDLSRKHARRPAVRYVRPQVTGSLSGRAFVEYREEVVAIRTARRLRRALARFNPRT
jgi:hypothetical protein